MGNEKILKQIFAVALDAVIQVGATGVVNSWNTQAEKIFGWSAEEAIGEMVSDLIIPSQHKKAHIDGMKRFLVTRQGRVLNTRIEITGMRKNGEEFSVELAITPIETDNGTEFSAFLRDLTAKKDSEKLVEAQKEKLIHNTKMAALGEMASGIAHEINNPLTIITGYSNSVRKKILLNKLDDEFLLQSMDKIEKTTQRIATIIQGLKNIARNSENDPLESVNIKDVLKDTYILSKEKFKNQLINLQLIGIDQDIMVSGRKAQLTQVLLNLLNNSVDAIEELNEKWVLVEVILMDKSVSISVTDSGNGIEGEVLKKLMQPFFTTKPIGKGTGLGLSISKGIIEEEHNGSFYYDDANEHTRFVLELPLLE